MTGYHEVRQVLVDPRLRKAPTPAHTLARQLLPDLAPAILTHMLRFDGAEHARLRKLVGPQFTHRRVQQLGPRVQQIADDLLDELCECEQVDLIPGFAYPLPIAVICELLGIPDDSRGDFQKWSSTISRVPQLMRTRGGRTWGVTCGNEHDRA